MLCFAFEEDTIMSVPDAHAVNQPVPAINPTGNGATYGDHPNDHAVNQPVPAVNPTANGGTYGPNQPARAVYHY